jgi:hypothetical protein
LAFSTCAAAWPSGQQFGEQLRVLDRGGADQHRLAAFVAVADVGDDGAYFSFASVDQVVVVLATIGTLVGISTTFPAVDLLELVGFGVGRAGHAGQLAVHAEVVLEGDRGQRLVLGWICTPSLASTAWCRPSDQRRPGIMRPVNSSTMTTSPFCTM